MIFFFFQEMVWPLMTLIQPLPPKIVIMSTMLIVATEQNQNQLFLLPIVQDYMVPLWIQMIAPVFSIVATVLPIGTHVLLDQHLIPRIGFANGQIKYLVVKNLWMRKKKRVRIFFTLFFTYLEVSLYMKIFFLLSGVFQCPQNFLRGVNTKHPHPQDCRQFFVCISGTAREYGCPLGSVFKITQNEDGVCADPADVGKP